jgi:hypothetical protein
MRKMSCLSLLGFFLSISTVFGAASLNHKTKKPKKEALADGAHYCALINKQIGEIGNSHELDIRLQIFTKLLRELIVVQEYQAIEKAEGKNPQFPKCVESYKLVIDAHREEIKKQNHDSYENRTLLADYKYVTGSYREAMNEYSVADNVISGDINSGTKEIASIVQLLSKEPKERLNIAYWEKRILHTLKGVKAANKDRPTILEELKMMSKDLGYKVVRIIEAMFFNFAFASFTELKVLGFGAGVGHFNEGTLGAEDVSQRFVRHKGFSQIIMTREDLLNLIKEKNAKGGSGLRKALGSLFPNIPPGEINIEITNNTTNINQDSDENIEDEKDASKAGGISKATSATDKKSSGINAIAKNKDGSPWDPSMPLTGGGGSTGGSSYFTDQDKKLDQKTLMIAAKLSSSNGMSPGELAKHDARLAKKEFCSDSKNASSPDCQKGERATADTSRKLVGTETDRPTVAPIIIVQQSSSSESSTSSEPIKPPKPVGPRLVGGSTTPVPPENPQPPVSITSRFKYSPECFGRDAVSGVVEQLRGFDGDLTKSARNMGGLFSCGDSWNGFIKQAQQDCDVTVGVNKRCGGEKEGDAEACRESVKSVASGMAMEFYGGDPAHVADAVKEYSETGKMPSGYINGPVCDFAGLVNTANKIRLYGGGSGGTISGVPGGSVAH